MNNEIIDAFTISFINAEFNILNAGKILLKSNFIQTFLYSDGFSKYYCVKFYNKMKKSYKRDIG